jgi:hypothetical protein
MLCRVLLLLSVQISHRNHRQADAQNFYFDNHSGEQEQQRQVLLFFRHYYVVSFMQKICNKSFHLVGRSLVETKPAAALAHAWLAGMQSRPILLFIAQIN